LGTDTHTQIRAPLQHCFFRTMSLWTLSVVTLSGNQADIEVDPASSPSEVLAALGDFAAAERGVQRDLLHEEQRLMWDTTLAESGVADGSTLTLVRTTLSEAQQQANDEALIVAAKQGELGEVKRLLSQAGATVEASDRNGWRPLHQAASNGHVELVKLLVLEDRAEVNARTNDSRTPLFMAAAKGHLETAKCLVEARAEVNATGNHGETPLYWAAERGHVEVAKCLVEAQAKVNAMDLHGQTPLSMVCKGLGANKEHKEAIEALLREAGLSEGAERRPSSHFMRSASGVTSTTRGRSRTSSEPQGPAEV